MGLVQVTMFYLCLTFGQLSHVSFEKLDCEFITDPRAIGVQKIE